MLKIIPDYSHSEIFMSIPNHFDDPFDCRIPIAYFLLESDKKMRDKYFDEMVRRQFSNYNESQVTNVATRMEEVGVYRDFRRMLYYDRLYFEEIGKLWGIFSMTTQKLNSLIWAHYADNHKGICVGFDPKILFQDHEKFGYGGKVNYLDKFSLIRPDANFIEQSVLEIYSKSSEWKYEDEYRVDKLMGADTCVEYDGSALKQLFLGYRMATDEKN